jgi:hypothetical protein
MEGWVIEVTKLLKFSQSVTIIPVFQYSIFNWGLR